MLELFGSNSTCTELAVTGGDQAGESFSSGDLVTCKRADLRTRDRAMEAVIARLNSLLVAMV